MIPFLFATQLTACNLSNININNWIEIDALIIIAMFSIGALIYSLSSLFSSQTSKKIKGNVIYELSEGIISLLIFLSLISLVYASCSVGSSLSGQSNYQNIFQADSYYIGNLLFVKGTSLVTVLSFQGIAVAIDGNIVTLLLGAVTGSLNNELGAKTSLISLGSSGSGSSSGSSGSAQIGGENPTTNPTLGFGISLSTGSDVEGLFDTYAGTYAVYGAAIVVTFGLLFVLYLLIPIITALSFTLVVPISLILRSLGFLGPSVRSISNTLLALAIAFYIVFPLTISMNSFVVNWIYCSNNVTVCNPYTAYTGNYKLSTIPLGSLLKQNTVNFLNYGGFPLSLPTSFYGSIIGNGGGIGQVAKNLLEGIINLPNQVAGYSTEVAQYFFEGVLLVAIDLMITLAFAQGLTKALNQIPHLIN
ncbi:MAG: hypothetical protein QXD23_00485 [Candidatus Micrarchaeaceae archaeon]